VAGSSSPAGPAAGVILTRRPALTTAALCAAAYRMQRLVSADFCSARDRLR
jgi:hypothetical protein